MKGISYSEYLFSNLLKLYDKEFEEMEYDLQFESIRSLYNIFFNSKFNDVNKGEYDCIIAYLKDKYKAPEEDSLAQIIFSND